MDAKLSQLINQLLELRADPAEVERLSELLRSDPKAAEEYLNLLRVHQGMANLVAPVRDFSAQELLAIQSVDQRLGKYFGPEADLDGSSDDRSPLLRGDSPAGHRSHHYLPWVIAALAVAAAVVLALLPLLPDGDRLANRSGESGQRSAAGRTEADDLVARVIKKVDCDWEEDRWNIATSVEIHAGQQINLSRGMLVLKFDSGPEVTLNGPATFVATSRTSAQLLEGTLSARVPPEGRGFRVETHAGDFVDLGTEFGMIITKEGAVETHVFKGQVRAEPVATGNEQTEPVLLEQGDAWSRREQGETTVNGKAKPERFMRLVSDGELVSVSRPPVDKRVSLWFDASEGVQLDPEKRVYAWANLAAGLSEDETVDAWQVNPGARPRWLAHSIGDRPALRFDGFKGLTTEPLVISGSNSSAVVFRVDFDRAIERIEKRIYFKHLGVQLLNLNGPPHTVLQVNGDRTLESRVHRGFLKDRVDPVDVGMLRTKQKLTDGPHVAVYSYDGAQGVARLWLDGRMVSETHDAPLLQATSAPRFLGSHYDRKGFGFTGEIAEILVVDEPLTLQEAKGVSDWLLDKYSITAAESPEQDQ